MQQKTPHYTLLYGAKCSISMCHHEAVHALTSHLLREINLATTMRKDLNRSLASSVKSAFPKVRCLATLMRVYKDERDRGDLD